MTRKILFLAGSPTDDFHADLSRVYASDCLQSLVGLASHELSIAWFSPDGLVRFPKTLQRNEIATARPVSLIEACQEIVRSDFDAVVPQMFCPRGMTDYRSLFETFGIPLVGNSSLSMANTMDKAKSRAIAKMSNVPIPEGQVISDLTEFDVELPVVVKPARADNSHGITLANTIEDLTEAFRHAQKFDDKIVIERFVPLGREVRCATLVRDGKIMCLPLQEYQMDPDDQPIRDEASKLTRTEDGSLDLTSKLRPTSWIVDVEDPATAAVWSIARQCHEAFECRDYGLFDFRIDPEGHPFFLEAGLYCSFAPKSIVAAVAEAAGIPLADLFIHCVDLATDRDQRCKRYETCQVALE